MKIKIKKTSTAGVCAVYIIHQHVELKTAGLEKKEIEYVKKKFEDKQHVVFINRFDHLLIFQNFEEFAKKNADQTLETFRGLGHQVCTQINAHKYASVQLVQGETTAEQLLAIAEGCALSNYEFIHYKTIKKEAHSFEEIVLVSDQIKNSAAHELEIIIDAVWKARDLVNEPQSFLNSETFAKEIQSLGKKGGMNVEVLHKKQIEALKMGGLLAVNKGSVVPPTFSIIEYKSAKAKNKKPLVLIGKGVVYDTGGLSLKPTPNSMDSMKCDMAGGALVACAMYAIAKAELPVHVIGLIPATDNRPGGDAYTPGDVVTMFDGKTVEVLNTDAEGRMLLADALAYAKKYHPSLVLDFATLTGAAAATIGPHGIVCMGNAPEEVKNALKESGNAVYERLVEFPLWDEYANLIKSDIADMKNIGGPIAGAITAGKFLEKFVDFNWMHFDIAGPAYVSAADSYRGKNGTGYGVRLVFDFVKNQLNTVNS